MSAPAINLARDARAPRLDCPQGRHVWCRECEWPDPAVAGEPGAASRPVRQRLVCARPRCGARRHVSLRTWRLLPTLNDNRIKRRASYLQRRFGVSAGASMARPREAPHPWPIDWRRWVA